MTLAEIERTCDKIRKKYNIVVPIDDGYELAYKMNGHVRESKDMPEEEVGLIRKYRDSFWITLNGNLTEVSKKIIIAQLIGVFCLYTPFNNDPEAWEKCPEINIKITDDMMVNGLYFAKEILMPKYLFTPYFCENITIAHKINLRTLADIFNVPVELVRERGIDLNMIVPRVPQKAPVE